MKHSLMKLFFGEGTNIQEVGFLVRRADGSLIGPIFAKFGFFVGDDPAINAFWQTKGAAANLNCLLCQNVCRVGSDIAAHDDSGYLIDHAEGNPSRFHLHSDDSIWQCFDSLLLCAPERLNSLEITLGLRCDPDGLLACKELRPYVKLCSNTMFDFGHVFLIDGMFQVELTEFLARAKPLGLKYATLHQWFRLKSLMKFASLVALLFP